MSDNGNVRIILGGGGGGERGGIHRDKDDFYFTKPINHI